MKLIDTNEIGGEHIIDRNKSIFNGIKALSDNPFEWLSQSMADYIDQEYYLNHSGEKPLSPIFERLLAITGKTTEQVVTDLARIIANKFEDKWNKLYTAFIDSDYKPLENYSMDETETPNITRDSTENTKTKIETETENDKTENTVHGFNSASPVPSSESERNAKVTVSGGANDNESHRVDKETGTRTLNRHGNIGVTTSQQMLESEIKLRSNFNFINTIMMDVDSVITLPIYF